MSDDQHIGEIIRERRLARGYSLGQLATRLGKTPAVVRAWERGEDSPDAAVSETLFATLEIDLGEIRDLVGGPEGEAVDADVSVGETADEAVEESVVGVETASDDEPVEPEDATDEEVVPHEARETDEAAAPAAAADAEPAEHEVLDEASRAALAELPTEAMPAPVATMAPPLVEPSGYDVIEPVVAEVPPPAPITVPPLRLPNPIRLLFDPHRRFLYWIRYALTIVVLIILLRVFLWAAGELWTALGDLLDTFRATDGEEEEVALRFLFGL